MRNHRLTIMSIFGTGKRKSLWVADIMYERPGEISDNFRVTGSRLIFDNRSQMKKPLVHVFNRTNTLDGREYGDIFGTFKVPSPSFLEIEHLWSTLVGLVGYPSALLPRRR